MRSPSRRGGALIWGGIALMLLPLPLIALTEGVELGAGDPLQLAGLAAPGVGFPLLAAGRLRRRVAVEGDDAYPARFGRAARLRRLGGFAATLLQTSYCIVLGIAIGMLALAGLTALFTHSSLTFDDQPMGAVGEGILACAMSTMASAGVWLVLGVLLYGGLAAGYSLRLLLSRSSTSGERTVAGTVLLAILIAVGVIAVVVAGNAGIPAHPRAARGAIATAGVAAILGGVGLSLLIAWRRGFRPGASTGASALPDGRGGVVIRGIGALILLGWMVAALISAWRH